MKRLIYGVAIATLMSTAALQAATLQENQDFLQQLQRGAKTRQQGPLPRLSVPLKTEDTQWAGEMRQRLQRGVSPGKAVPPALYLVSFSIPEDGLKQMLASARRFGIPVVVRGLVHNSFRETVQAVFRLNKGTNQGGVEIDPRPFTRYGIRSVPALVLTCGEQHDLLYGNQRIADSLEEIAREGDCRNVAKTLLKKGSPGGEP
ncbi:type-F conjugative transfer system pilin assembly protein TrbC [Klebsiella aerogenes]|uniref:type-F conjugative transfer system pilin assembly protein TrbC n=1 Tax=Klebsiella aerogenes TaxID=548 RepID=UPI000DA1377C|nr:type-F conjugative transfer system pilin assembly protein TrbC [Klebsiella aerogenes]HCB2859839.1 type-F conjugative transfer system pilin assembly protein TrbC [Klebsiella aerogenes]HCB2864842.1 type-F conjugative transfer system pilin assembly protein TrbC [Klebsiella aerogenes]HCB2880486.1 type-F conjugative transfer system pilin assembly protein TrbC [Klebsiella aerogenes]HCB3345905.1 type-F conjugative transfer system pilin assembly protein TrbC [Klebsiella aerogenes]HCM1811907.1 type-